jgi:protocatechuate 3,4-dioxygenase beta subunit
MKVTLRVKEDAMSEAEARELSGKSASGYFTEENSADVVIGRMLNTQEPRLRQVMTSLIRHLHAFVKDAEPTESEWMAAIDFLTRTGHMCTDWRQEFILLSDILGASMLVDAINHRKPSGATETTVLGPFHVANAPRCAAGANICLDGKGQPLVVRGRVLDTDERPIVGALLDIWQTNNDGYYDVQQKGAQPDMNLRGIFETDSNGSFWFRSVKPRFYPIPDDGPVGELLKATGRHPYRPAHIHFIVSAAGYEPITTHLFSPDCPYLHTDAVFGVKKSLLGNFRQIDDPSQADSLGFSNPFWSLEYDFVLAARHPRFRDR